MTTAEKTTQSPEKKKPALKASTGRNLSGLLPYLGRYKGAIALGLFTLALMGIIGNVVPLATGIITDTLAGSPRPFSHPANGVAGTVGANWLGDLVPYYQPNSRQTLLFYCLIVVVCIGLKGLFSFATRWILIGIWRDIGFDIRRDLLDRLLLMEPKFYVRNRTGELMSRATNDLNAVRMVLGPGIMYSARPSSPWSGDRSDGSTFPRFDALLSSACPIVAIVVRHSRQSDPRARRKNSSRAGHAFRQTAGKSFRRSGDPSVRQGTS